MACDYMRQRYTSLHKTSKFSDCCFIVEDEKIYSHKVILATSSPVFEAMLYGPLASSDNKIQDISALEFKQMLTFIYTDTVQITSILNAWALVYIAKKYLIDDLLEYCLCYIRKKLEAGNVLLNYEFAELFHEETILDLCMNTVRMYGNIVLNSDYHVKSDTLCKLLEQDEFNANEVDLIKVAIKWGAMECQRTCLDPSKPNIRAVLINAGALARLRLLPMVSNNASLDLIATILKEEEIDLLRSYKLNESYENELKLRCLNFCLDSSPRKSVRFMQKIGFRDVLKTGFVFKARVDSKLTTQMTANKCVFINGFLLPARRAPEANRSADYTECLNLTITDVLTKKSLTLTCVETLMYGTVHTLKTGQPFLLEEGRKYDVDVTWLSDYLQCTNEYIMHYLSPSFVSRDVKFEFSDPFDYGFIQGVCYCTF